MGPPLLLRRPLGQDGAGPVAKRHKPTHQGSVSGLATPASTLRNRAPTSTPHNPAPASTPRPPAPASTPHSSGSNTPRPTLAPRQPREPDLEPDEPSSSSQEIDIQEPHLELTDDECDEPPASRKKKPISPDDAEAKLTVIQIKWGRILARIIDPFSNPKFIFSVGIRLENKQADGLSISGYSDNQLRLFNSYVLFIFHLVEVDTYTSRLSQETDKTLQQSELHTFYYNLAEGQDASRNDDTGLIKIQVVEMLHMEFDDEAKGIDQTKTTRGFGHALTRRLLVPDYSYDPEDEAADLFRSQLLVNCFKALFLGPSSWRLGGPKTKCAPKASICNLTEVSGRTIAYVATLGTTIDFHPGLFSTLIITRKQFRPETVSPHSHPETVSPHSHPETVSPHSHPETFSTLFRSDFPSNIFADFCGQRVGG
ncbi:hypothetical protein M422DRAFT_248650 [Sphaerobolus stellatus SS14]|nr:hypothetical protein M422DRAFT_248650 [Sphaerobolus stellatus SS14]